jgi:CubicO group peptidase (beta-lactamase class C family)
VFPIFSTSKAITALAVQLAAERGLLELDAPIADYWPEYGTHGKHAITLRHVLAHRAGVPQMPPEVTPELLGDWDWVTTRLAELQPMFPPGTTNAYHSMSFGWLLGEVLRRTDPLRRPFARIVEQELCAPLGVHSFWFGVPPKVEAHVAQLTFPQPPPPPSMAANLAVPPQVALAPEVFNRADVHAACIPAVGAVANARSAARLFSVFANRGKPLLSEMRVRGLLEPRPDYALDDETYGRPMPVGVGGLWIEAQGVVPPGRPGGVLCHPGAGGTVTWAELGSGLAVSICHDRMFGPVAEHPFTAVAEAVRAALLERTAA